MRTVELSDEIYEQAEQEAAEKGIAVDTLVEQLIRQGIPSKPIGMRVKFPIFESKNPGALKITKEVLDQIELEDDLRRSGLLGYE